MSAENAEVREAVEQAVSEALRTVDGAMLTRWVLLAEVIDGESGERAVWCLTPDDAKAWDVSSPRVAGRCAWTCPGASRAPGAGRPRSA